MTDIYSNLPEPQQTQQRAFNKARLDELSADIDREARLLWVAGITQPDDDGRMACVCAGEPFMSPCSCYPDCGRP